MEELIVNQPNSSFSLKHSLSSLVESQRELRSDPSEHVKREFRLRKSSDFKRVWRYGKSYAHPLMVLIVRRNQDDPTRIAVSAGRSVGKAVQRNRAKRLLREAIKPILAQIEPGWDIVLIARKPLTETSLQQTHSVLVELMKKTKLLNSKNNHEC